MAYQFNPVGGGGATYSDEGQIGREPFEYPSQISGQTTTDPAYQFYNPEVGAFLVGSFTHDDLGNFQYADDPALVRAMLAERGIPYTEIDGLPYVNEADHRRFYASLPPRDRSFTPFGGPRIWQEALESVGIPGDPIGGMIQKGQGPLLVAAVATAGIASGAFGGAVAAEELALSEGAIIAAESGAIEGTAFTAIEAGEIGAEFVASEYAGTELAAEFATEFAGEEIAGEFFVEEIASEEFATELFVEEIAAPEVGAFSEPVYTPQPSPAPSPFPSIPGGWTGALSHVLIAGLNYAAK